MGCPECGSNDYYKHHEFAQDPIYKCNKCNREFSWHHLIPQGSGMELSDKAFKLWLTKQAITKCPKCGHEF